MILCPNCKIEEARTSFGFGIIPCLTCTQRHQQASKPSHQIEFTTQEVKDGRKECARDIIQPFHSGELSKEYIQAYGSKSVKATEEEVKKSKPVWGDLTYYK